MDGWHYGSKEKSSQAGKQQVQGRIRIRQARRRRLGDLEQPVRASGNVALAQGLCFCSCASGVCWMLV